MNVTLMKLTSLKSLFQALYKGFIVKFLKLFQTIGIDNEIGH